MDAKNPDVVLRTQGGRRMCRVIFSYEPMNDDELKLNPDDEIEFLSEVEEGWWRGKLKGRVGVFPSNFVTMLEIAAAAESITKAADADDKPLPVNNNNNNNQVPALPPKPVKEQCRVLFPYEAAVEDELTLNKGDIVTIITKDVEDKGWWKGELRGKIGLFPDNFVEIISPAGENVLPKKPERPAKSSLADNSHKDSDNKNFSASSPQEVSTTENQQEPEKSKNAELNIIKADTVAAHKKSLEQKALESNSGPPPPIGKKPNLSPSNRPLSQINPPWKVSDILNQPKKPEKNANNVDASDGALPSKVLSTIASKRASLDISKETDSSEELDLDSVSRSDMLNHITASRPKAPGRRPPSTNRESDPPITNGSSPPKETKWEKLRPPWVDELKINLKTSEDSKHVIKTTTTKVANDENKSASNKAADKKIPFRHSKVAETTQIKHEEANHVSVASKVSELSSVFSKTSDNESSLKKEIFELRQKVDKLEKLVVDLAAQLREESDKRRIIEKELNKLTDLVTQV